MGDPLDRFRRLERPRAGGADPEADQSPETERRIGAVEPPGTRPPPPEAGQVRGPAEPTGLELDDWRPAEAEARARRAPPPPPLPPGGPGGEPPLDAEALLASLDPDRGPSEALRFLRNLPDPRWRLPAGLALMLSPVLLFLVRPWLGLLLGLAVLALFWPGGWRNRSRD
jgi:hypothetical protein